MTFTKYVALMLLGFALFVGYRAYAKREAHIEQCRIIGAELDAEAGNINNSNTSVPAAWSIKAGRESTLCADVRESMR